MELQQIRYVMAVAQHQSFTKAADALSVSLPTLSEQVRRVEQGLGIALFSRTTRRVGLTAAGHVFVDHASRLMADFAALREAVQRQAEVPEGVIKLGMPPGVAPSQLWPILAQFGKDYPGIRIGFVETTYPQLVKNLHDGSIDVSILSWPSNETPSDLTFIELARERTALVVSPNNALSGRQDAVAVRELEHMPLVTFVEGYSLRTIALDLCHRAGFSPMIALESSIDETVVQLVRADLGYAILPVAMAAAASLSVLECEPEPMDRALGIAWSIDRQLTPIAVLLRDRIIEGCKRLFVRGAPR